MLAPVPQPEKCALCFDAESCLILASWPPGADSKVKMCAECRGYVKRREANQKRRELPQPVGPRKPRCGMQKMRAPRKTFPLHERIAVDLARVTGLPKKEIEEALREGRKPEDIRAFAKRG